MNEHTIFFSFEQGTKENISTLVDNNQDLQNFFNTRCSNVKRVPAERVWNYLQDAVSLNKVAMHMLSNISNSRMSSYAIYDSVNMCYEWDSNDINLQNQFNSAKLHWIINDIKISGLGYPPQGFMQGKKYVCHPGTYRYYAAFAQQINTDVSVWDTHNEFTDIEPMDLKEWIQFCSEGFIRKTRVITVESDSIENENRMVDNNYRQLEVHETSNHHDHCIFNNDFALGEMYNYTRPTIYAPNNVELSKIQNKLTNPDLFKFSVTRNKFLIPSMQNFLGVGFYIERASDINHDPTHLFLYLDTNDDIAVCDNNSGMILFNCGAPNNKKLIPEIVNESGDTYLNKYLWCSKVSKVPEKIGEHL